MNCAIPWNVLTPRRLFHFSEGAAGFPLFLFLFAGPSTSWVSY